MYQRISKNWQTLPLCTREGLFCLILVSMTLLVYWPIQYAEFITYDDQLHITNNLHLKSGFSWQTLFWAFSTDYGGNWHPLTWLSFMADYQMFGLKASGYHTVNLIIHLMNSALLFLVFHRMTGVFWPSAFVSVLFALHPMHVEAVAWVSERKDLLCTFWGFLAIGAYQRYVKVRQLKYYLLLVLFFCLALMSKPMILTLPFVLLLLDYWPLRRIQLSPFPQGRERLLALRGPVVEKIPLLVLTFLSALVTYLAQQSWGAVNTLTSVPMALRLTNALDAYGEYILKFVWPAELSIFYPFFLSHPIPEMAVWSILLAGVTVIAIRGRHRYPYVIVGWLIFIGTLIPVIGIIKVGSQSMADRYTYIPYVGLSILVAWGIPDMTKRVRRREVCLAVAAIAVTLLMSITTRHQVAYWHDSVTLFTHALQVTAPNETVHNNLGSALLDQGRLDESLVHYRAALALKPDEERFHKNVGVVLYRQGRYEDAIRHFRTAIRLNGRYSDGYYHLGNVFFTQGRFGEAARQYAETILLQPDHADAHNGLAMLLIREGRIEEAISHLKDALRLKPDYAEAWNNLGVARAYRGELRQAVEHFDQALRLDPDYVGARNNRESVSRQYSSSP